MWRKVGQQTLEISFLKGSLQLIEEQRILQSLTGKPRRIITSRRKPKKVAKGSSQKCCAMGEVSRAGSYRYDPDREDSDYDLDLRSEMLRIALEFSGYGRPRTTAELKRHSWQVNHKRVARIILDHILLCLRRKTFTTTTDSRHGLPVHPNFARDMKLTRINELWIADITYICYPRFKTTAVCLVL